jgi:hypothetical protein
MQATVSHQGTEFGLAADGDFGGEQRKAKCQHQRQVNHQKQSASVLCRKVRKPPYITKSDGTARRRQYKSYAALKGAAPVFVFHSSLKFCAKVLFLEQKF